MIRHFGELVERVATTEHPMRDAVVFYRGRECLVRLSYAELSRRIRGFARDAAGSPAFERGQVVGLLSPNAPEVPEIVLASLARGVTLVPLNPAARPEVWKELLDDAGAGLLMVHPSLHGRLPPGLDIPVLILGNAASIPSDYASSSDGRAMNRPAHERADIENDAARPLADAPAVILYTSGTTARPKGVVLSQAALLTNAQLMASRLCLHEATQLAVLPLHHAHALGVGLLTALCSGGTLVFTDGIDVLNFNWAHIIREERVSFTSCVPHLLSLLERCRVSADQVPTLRHILVSSAPLSRQQAARFVRSGISLLHGWGLSEFANFATCIAGDTAPEERRRLLFDEEFPCVGTPLPGVDVSVRSESGLVLGAGQVGELYIQGPCTMLGYHGNPAATEQALRDGSLRTGDLGFWRSTEQGHRVFYVSGRAKEIIIRGGEKISPVAVERYLLRQLPEAEGRIAVLGMPNQTYGEEVAAYWHGSSSDPLLEELISAAETLPSLERPKIVLCGELPIPRTHTGKVQRRHLVHLFERFRAHTGPLRVESIGAEESHG